MSSSAEAVPSPDFSTSKRGPAACACSRCPRCTRRYHPPHPEGCWPCRRVTKTRPRLVEKSIDEIESEEQAEDAMYYFLESFHGHPDGD